MTLSSRLAGALSFAHLAGIGARRSKAARADDDLPEDDDRADDDERDDDNDREPDGKKGKRARRAKRAKAGKRADDDDPDAEDDDPDAEDDDPDADADDPDAEDDDDDKDPPLGRKARRAKRADDDDPDAEDDEDEMRGKSAVARARRRERARCAAIFGSRHAARNPALAANLAFNTSMSRKEALAVLRDTPGGSAGSHGRADRNPKLGSDGGQSSSRAEQVAGSWERAMGKVRG